MGAEQHRHPAPIKATQQGHKKSVAMPEGINHCGPLFLNKPIRVWMGPNADPGGAHKKLPVGIESRPGKGGQQSVVEQGSFFQQPITQP
jgi:hypothetical protein